MKFDDAKEKMSTIHKLHTARDSEGETIFYKKPFSAKWITVVTDTEKMEMKSFELKNVIHMSLSELGLLIQYKPVDKMMMFPYPLREIEDIIVES